MLKTHFQAETHHKPYKLLFLINLLLYSFSSFLPIKLITTQKVIFLAKTSNTISKSPYDQIKPEQLFYQP